MLANQMTVAWVLGIDGDGGVTGNGFRSRGRNLQARSGFLDDLNSEVIKLALLRCGDDFLIRGVRSTGSTGTIRAMRLPR